MSLHSNTKSSPLLLFHWSAIIVAIAGLFFLYKPTFYSLFNYWNEYGTYSHGYLTILLSIYLLYVCVKDEELTYERPSIFSAVCLFLLSIIWLCSYLAKINTLQALCLPFLLFFTITFFSGLKNYRKIIIPVFILLFTIPLWGIFLPYLQDIAVIVTGKMLGYTDIDYFIVKNQVVISNGIFEIEESCSGLRYLLVGVLLAVVYGYQNYQSDWSVLALITISIGIMFIANFVRILVIILLGVEKGIDYHLVQDHENLGWVVFTVFLIPLFLIARFINPKLLQTYSFFHRSINNKEKPKYKFTLVWLVMLYWAILIFAPLYANYLTSSEAQQGELQTLSNFTSNEKGWGLSSSKRIDWVPDYHDYNERLSLEFDNNNARVALNAALYVDLGVSEGELINSQNQLVDPEYWNIVKQNSNASISGVEGLASVNMNTIQNIRGDRCLRIWYWYHVGKNSYTNEIQVKLRELMMIFENKSGGAFVSIATECEENADYVLSSFIKDNSELLTNIINWQ